MAEVNTNGWHEYAKYILKALESNEEQHKDITSSLTKLITDVAVLKREMAMRASVTGVIGGGVMSVIVSIIIWLILK